MSDIDLDRLVFFDLETTGLEADCRIVQIAIVRGERIFQSLVNPEMPIPAESTAIHRITDDQVEDKPVFGEIADDVLAFIDGGVLSGFNIRKFDVPVLKRELARFDRELPSFPILDMFELNQKMNPRTLAWFYEHYTGEAMDQSEAHDAVYDCSCTRKAFLGMYEKHPEMPTELMALTSFAEPDRLPVANSGWMIWTPNQCEPSFNRGKYRGWALSDVKRVEPSYLEWLLRIDADATTKTMIQLFKSNREGYIELLKSEHPNRWEPQYLEFRLAMDRNQVHRYPDLVAIAESGKQPSLMFLAAAWAVLQKKPEAATLASAYMNADDPNVNLEKRHNFLIKNLEGKLEN